MALLETILVALIVALAVVYLYRTFRPKKPKSPHKSPGCGCGSKGCKIAKPR